MMQSRFFRILIVVVAAFLLLFGTGHGLMRQLAAAPGEREQTTFFYIAPGSSVSVVAMEAHKLRLVREPWHFKLITRWKGLDRALYAGEYQIAPHASLEDVLGQIKEQQTYKRRVIIPEGASVAEVEGILATSFGLDMAAYRAPEEGSLLPETYFYERGDTANEIVKRMQSALDLALDEYWAARAPHLPVRDRHETLVLASIVEKETGLADERPLVAAVFTNRLKKGMRLQSDPTVIYGISSGQPLGRSLTRTDLRNDTPYNTYRRNGLPPTPIANPGIAAVAAVLNPASVPYLYFVADGSGGHVFAETLSEHNRNVARWREIEKTRP